MDRSVRSDAVRGWSRRVVVVCAVVLPFPAPLTLLGSVPAEHTKALAVDTGGDVDTDRDGLSDFQELHKYGTDPKRADSDGDGKSDGDWLERREYAYTVRAVVQVMKPVTLEFLDDDFQDVRLLDETDSYGELEVILYPFGTANREIGADNGWRKPARELERWLDPGPTSDWTPQLRKELLAGLSADGIDLQRISDREAVERVSSWLMQRSEFHDGFTSCPSGRRTRAGWPRTSSTRSRPATPRPASAASSSCA